jgi:hypothetical protein
MFDYPKTKEQKLVKEYREVMEKLMEIVPRKRLQDQLTIWLTHKLTLKEKIREAHLLLQRYNKKKPNRLEAEIDFIISYFRLRNR